MPTYIHVRSQKYIMNELEQKNTHEQQWNTTNNICKKVKKCKQMQSEKKMGKKLGSA